MPREPAVENRVRWIWEITPKLFIIGLCSFGFNGASADVELLVGICLQLWRILSDDVISLLTELQGEYFIG